MAEPKKVSQEEYDEFRSHMEDKYGYEDMSDEEKADFDSKMDQVAGVGFKTDETDETDSTDDEEVDLCQYFGQKKLKDYVAFLSSASSFCCGVR